MTNLPFDRCKAAALQDIAESGLFDDPIEEVRVWPVLWPTFPISPIDAVKHPRDLFDE